MIRYRQAGLDDAAEIHALLLKLAPEIPLLVDTVEREEALYVLVRNCARSGASWVALDEGGTIVGFILAEPNQLGRHYAEHEILELHHAGVAREHRDRGVFASLVEKVQQRMVPVTASLPPQNRLDTARRLEKLGFRPAGETRLRWEPGKST